MSMMNLAEQCKTWDYILTLQDKFLIGFGAIYVAFNLYFFKIIFTNSAPLGRVGLGVAMSVCVWVCLCVCAIQLPREQGFLLRLRLKVFPRFPRDFPGFSWVFPFVFQGFLQGKIKQPLSLKKKRKKEKKLDKSRNLFKFVSVLLSASVERVGVSRMRDS